MKHNPVNSTSELVRSEPTTSRRQFLRLAALAGAAGLAGCAAPTPQVKEVVQTVEVTRPVEVTRVVEVTRPVEVVKTVEVPKEVVKPSPKLPWQYVALDVEQTRKLGHQAFYTGECAYGAFSAIMQQLADKVGFPYDQFPVDVMRFGAGGVAGQGTLCGALLGSAMAISLVVAPDTAKKMISDLIAWYSQTPFPSETANKYATNHEYLVTEYKSDKALAQSVSKSPLCHVSVTEWCKASHFASGSPERAERCGRLTGDVAAHAVELLNAQFAGSFAATYKLSSESQVCMTCHTKGENFEMGNFTQGQPGECLLCHEPHALK
ncbi:MAG: C-GCAxxG-C-C family protein [Anaerolineae bacterium]